MVEACTGGDPEIEASLNEMCEEEGPEKASRGMADAEVHVYLGKAIEALDAFLCEVAYIARASEGESEQRL